jgi:hypothetical protein
MSAEPRRPRALLADPRVRSALAWAVFAASVAAVLLWAVIVDRRHPAPTASAEITGPERTRFGLSEARRREIFQALVLGEPIDRGVAERESETAIWNRNHDSFFHQHEWRRVPQVCRQHGIPTWLGYLILDEGIRSHWPPPPGVTIYADDAPLAQKTRPLGQRRVLITGGSPGGGSP